MIILKHMVENISLDTTFAALADPTRRAILKRLMHGASTVSALAEPFNKSLPAISKHLTVLENAGLITRKKEGRTHHIILAAHPLKDAAEWLSAYGEFWEDSFDALAALLEEDDT